MKAITDICTGELVICGDLFDRGFAVTQQLWLLYKLESAAGERGGSVHVYWGIMRL